MTVYLFCIKRYENPDVYLQVFISYLTHDPEGQKSVFLSSLG